MECKFLSNGIDILYHNFLSPCCAWSPDSKWIQDHKIQKVDFVNWHKHKDLVTAREQLAQGQWPSYCRDCETIEGQGRQDSMRLNGASAYSAYGEDDITLEIRPGNVCNFACQTCWPAASTRVETFYKKANIINLEGDRVANNFVDYGFLQPIAHRLKSIIVLGGEPFYDPKCLEFLAWAKDHTTAELLMFTNGSVVDLDLLESFGRKITLVFSMDAVGTPAEYIRFGTDWPVVWANYQKVKTLPNVATRVNVTTSPYNYFYFPDVLELLLEKWPEVVSFGPTMEKIFNEQVVPTSLRPTIISKLERIIPRLEQADIEFGQKCNAVNLVKSIVNNLKELAYDPKLHQEFVDFVTKMDTVKNINLVDHCPEMAGLLTVEPS
jgi:sulfatase maturation enzyme AslB (radical SAM superfamily)